MIAHPVRFVSMEIRLAVCATSDLATDRNEHSLCEGTVDVCLSCHNAVVASHSAIACRLSVSDSTRSLGRYFQYDKPVTHALTLLEIYAVGLTSVLNARDLERAFVVASAAVNVDDRPRLTLKHRHSA
jgi:hypothetical protein